MKSWSNGTCSSSQSVLVSEARLQALKTLIQLLNSISVVKSYEMFHLIAFLHQSPELMTYKTMHLSPCSALPVHNLIVQILYSS